MSAPRIPLVSHKTKHPEDHKYKAYLRVEFGNTVLYYHFYINGDYIDVKKPHVVKCQQRIEDAVIYKFIKDSANGNEKLEERINFVIEKLTEKYKRNFVIINDS